MRVCDYMPSLHTYNVSYRKLQRLGGFRRVQVLIQVDANQDYLFEWMVGNGPSSPLLTRNVLGE